MTTDEYVPDEEQVRAWCRDGTGDYPDVMDEWLDRFLARVKRDAAREALDRAEHRIARLEAQTSIRGRAVIMYRERAREAETRIEAAQDMCDTAPDDEGLGPLSAHYASGYELALQDIRRALEG